jgi:hypothetical protein
MDMSSCLASSLVVLDEVSVVPDTANVRCKEYLR